MNKLNHDCLTIIFEVIYNDKNSLYPCLLVCKLWCKIVVPILWRNPWEIITKPFSNLKKFEKARKFFIIILLHLPEESRMLLKSQVIDKPQRRIPLLNHILNYIFKNQKIDILKRPQQKFLFNYISFCKYIKYKIHHYGPNLYEKIFQHYDIRQIRLLEQEIYKLFINKCHKIKFLDTIGVRHPLYRFPRAEISLAELHELYCSSKDDSSLFYGLAQICKFIEKFCIYLTSSNSGLAKLIEMQQKVKYLIIKNHINDITQNEYGDIDLAILKHAHNLIYVSLPIENFLYFYNHLFPKLINIKKLKLYNQIFDIFDIELYKNLFDHPKFQILQINLLFSATFYVASRIIQESDNNLQIILMDFNASHYTGQLLNIISQYCSQLKYLRIDLDDMYLHNFEQVLLNCQSLEGIYIYHYRDGIYLPEIGDKLLKILIKSAPSSLYKIDIGSYNVYKIDSLTKFFENWVGRKSLWLSSISIYDDDKINNNFNEMIEYYKFLGVIEMYKDFCFINEFKFNNNF
ncbi:hypothetical protein C1645_816797 [Glomus cerebriforme]|uniref:F-box domain-containing protein n=1 Tax=Glomus cerebriforme TaxID=658196 RepID=A0A397TKB6_9GLOM|nr:hypothetical protein C1645_816797 [Glomus cerebriforme]